VFRRLVFAATILTFVVVVVGAFVRLSDAGLGCPDWPLCYGKLTPSHAAEEIGKAEAVQPGGPVSMAKAWKEMFHRYIAKLLGLLIISIAVLAWMKRRELGQSPWLATALFGAVCLQGAFGAWTVTMMLMPVIVTGHLLGGMTVLSLLTWLSARQLFQGRPAFAPGLAPAWLARAAPLALALLACQIALGGWVSTNYAAMGCPDLPLCKGQLMPPMDFTHGFQLLRDLGKKADGEFLTVEALTAIHWMHRVGALLVFLFLGWFGSKLLKLGALRPLRSLGMALLTLLCVQVSIGIAVVAMQLPLHLAAAHNAGAALLLMTLVVINFRVFSATRTLSSGPA
jgi:cytochrome c oxidase assembly protein subunit 15